MRFWHGREKPASLWDTGRERQRFRSGCRKSHPGQATSFVSYAQDRFFNTELDKTLKAKGVTMLILTGWKISGSVLYTSVGATLRDYTVVIPVDASLGPNDYEEVIGLYQILNQNSANPTNQLLKEKTSTLSRTDLITFQ